jgi:hypothetical protein
MDVENEVALSLLELGHLNTVSPSQDPNEGDDCCSVKDEGKREEDFFNLFPSSIFKNLQDEISRNVDLCSKISQLQPCPDVYVMHDSMTTKTIIDSAIQCLLRDKDHTLDLIRKREKDMLSMARERERFRDLIGTPVRFSPRTFSSEGLSGIISFITDDL